jgi:AsmA protein
VQQQILSRVVDITGREMTFRDVPRVTFSPFLGIEISDVVFKDPNAEAADPPLLHMERMQAQLGILSALLGRAEISNFRFVRPHFNLRVYEDGSTSWAFPQGNVWDVLTQARKIREASPGAQTADLSGILPVTLGRFTIIDGTLAYENRLTGRSETLTNINGQMSWPDTRSPWSISGDCIWRSEAFTFSASSPTPLLVLSGGTAPVVVSLKSGAFDFSFEGEGNLIADLHLTGNGKLATPSVRRFAGLFGSALPAGSIPAEFSVSGTLDTTPVKFAFTEADVMLDGNAGRGALQLTLDKANRTKLTGTISAGAIDLSRYVNGIADGAAEPAVATSVLPMIDMELDLRLSAASAKLGALSLGDIAATVSIHNGEGIIDAGNATLFDGTLSGEVAIRRQGGEYLVEATAMGNDMDAGAAFLQAGTGPFGLTGTADADLKVRSRGATLTKLRENLWGEGSLQAQNGVLRGADFADLLRRAQAPAAAGDLKLTGETAFRTLSAKIAVDRNIADIRSLSITNSKVTAQIGGRADLAQGGLALRMLVTPTEAQPANAAPAPEARLFVGGSFQNPLLTRSRSYGGALEPGNEMELPEADPASLKTTVN